MTRSCLYFTCSFTNMSRLLFLMHDSILYVVVMLLNIILLLKWFCDYATNNKIGDAIDRYYNFFYNSTMRNNF